MRTRAQFLSGLLLFTSFIAVGQTNISAVLPNGREIHPEGNWVQVAPYPFAIALRSDRDELAVPSIGFPFALNIIQDSRTNHPEVRRMPDGHENDPATETDIGVVYSPDGKLLYVSTGDSGKVRAYRTTDWTVAGEVSLDGRIGEHQFTNSFASGMTASHEGALLYVVDQANWRVVIVDTRAMQLIASVSTGAYPIGVALSPDGGHLYVTNSGLFAYKTIPGADANKPLATGLHFPPFAYPSAEARNGVIAEGRNIPGLGDDNSPEGSSLWTYDVSDPREPALTAKLRLGDAIIDERAGTVGGASPTGVAADASGVYVALAHQDAIAKVSEDGSLLIGQAALSPFPLDRFHDSVGRPLRGVMPGGVVVRDGRVYVAESGINAVAVIDAGNLRVMEHIPVGWNPSAVGLSQDGKTLYVVNAKGRGAGPNGGTAYDANAPSYIGSLEYGSVSVIALTSLKSPDVLTRTVVNANLAAQKAPSTLPRLKHCFLIIRENRTFDEVLGDLRGANGDASLARYGMDGWAAENSTATHLRVTPNLHALAKQFATSDNFYVDSDVSADGHRWIVGIQPTPYFNTAWTANYGGRRHEDPFAAQPGRRALFGGADAPMPEDEPQFGSLWEHVAAEGSGILNYGEGLEVEGNSEMDGAAPEGQRLFLNAPVPRPIFESTDRHYPTFNLGIPDQFRVAEFERDFRRRLATAKVPSLIVIRLPGDHTAEPRPQDGYPYRASFVADNDLALGRIISFLSRTSIWKDSAVFVTEDDAQGGVDHVDAHRSVLLVASPWTRPGAISHAHTSMGSITRTIDELLGLGPLNLEDALAGELLDVFDTAPHLQPYSVARADRRVFIPSRARLARPKTRRQAAALHDMDDADEIRTELESSRPSLRRSPRP